MAISKKLRFEVFKRDGFQCQYCGKAPPKAILEVDHIIPKKRKGRDEIDNLITACFDCNRGKGARDLRVSPDSIKEKLENIKERELQLKELYKHQKAIRKRIENDIDYLDQKWFGLEGKENYCFTELYRKKVRHLLRIFNKYEIEEAMEIAWIKPYLKDRFAYMCGILWTKKRKRESDAQ